MSSHAEHHAKGRSLVALDALNVFMADVRDGLGPFLAIYLAAAQHWTRAGSGSRCRSRGSPPSPRRRRRGG